MPWFLYPVGRLRCPVMVASCKQIPGPGLLDGGLCQLTWLALISAWSPPVELRPALGCLLPGITDLEFDL